MPGNRFSGLDFLKRLRYNHNKGYEGKKYCCGITRFQSAKRTCGRWKQGRQQTGKYIPEPQAESAFVQVGCAGLFPLPNREYRVSVLRKAVAVKHR